ncbi:hypothetical protein HJG54_19605 [Leptolyngbya sp. NK1-12]|uniref:Uncharacterized protein n=1 Tax=Leptolyngbya sp. NK1-12 TaxID=2547451 RepID=A0AA96WGU9_9CYAN|nr:hypothetical protein [Leptolyngbya sp. NK1-12]WNZ24834.1 hypothetical protein HJG54_19605 [Leptolyngbya sp. NK1-12]
MPTTALIAAGQSPQAPLSTTGSYPLGEWLGHGLMLQSSREARTNG